VTKYEHTQIGYTIIWVALGVAVFAAITGIFAQGGPGTFLIIEVTPDLRGGILQTDNQNRAVAITLRNGRKFALGTDDPKALVDAIERVISHI
jgi:hypothetical protein